MTACAAQQPETSRRRGRGPAAYTGRQKLALSLEKAQYSHAQIAKILGLSTRQAATRLLVRARAARDARTAELRELLAELASDL